MQQQPHMFDGISVRPGRITRWHASMAASARLGCPCGACDPAFVASPLLCRVASSALSLAEPSLPSLPCAGRRRIPRFVLSSPQNAPTSRAGAHSFFALRPRTLMQKRIGVTSDRALYSRCGPKKVREQFAVRAATRGLPRALPQDQQKFASQRVAYAPHARTTAYGCDPP